MIPNGWDTGVGEYAISKPMTDVLVSPTLRVWVLDVFLFHVHLG